MAATYNCTDASDSSYGSNDYGTCTTSSGVGAPNTGLFAQSSLVILIPLLVVIVVVIVATFVTRRKKRLATATAASLSPSHDE